MQKKNARSSKKDAKYFGLTFLFDTADRIAVSLCMFFISKKQSEKKKKQYSNVYRSSNHSYQRNRLEEWLSWSKALDSKSSMRQTRIEGCKLSLCRQIEGGSQLLGSLQFAEAQCCFCLLSLCGGKAKTTSRGRAIFQSRKICVTESPSNL